MPKPILSLDHLSKHDAASFGGKAANLGELTKSGFRVPRGFAISVDSYRLFVIENQLSGTIAQIARLMDGEDESNVSTKLTELRSVMAEGNVPLEVESAILRAYRSLTSVSHGQAKVAVRSSAIGEDEAEASFAGQHDTYLNVIGEKALLKAIKRCWASLWNERAVRYREQKRFEVTEAAMAVVVQSMIDPETAGVMFTLSPFSGSKNECVIEAAEGLGDALVSGKINPDRYIINREAMKLVESEDTQQTLTEHEAIELAKLGSDVETRFGRPQDIEWAYADGDFYILQTRPITALPQAHRPRDIWTNANVLENLPEIVSPLTRSLVEDIDDVFHFLLGAIGVRLPKDMKFIKVIAGRVYLNAGGFQLACAAIPGFSPQLLTQFLGGLEIDSAPDESSIRMAIGGKLLLLPRALLFSFYSIVLTELVRSRSAVLLRHIRAAEAVDWRRLSLAELMRSHERWMLTLMNYAKTSLPCSAGAFAFWTILRSLVRRWYGADSDPLLARLLTGLSGMVSAQPSLELWKLSRKIARDEKLAKVFEESEIGCIEQEICRHGGEAGREILKELDVFFAQHGYRCSTEIEFSIPRWSEDRPLILGMLKTYLQGTGEINPLEFEARQRRERRAAEREIQKKLSAFRWMALNFVLRRTQKHLLLRDETKAHAVHCLYIARKIVLAIGEKLADDGFIQEADDIFFLTVKEIEGSAQSKRDRAALGAIIDERKAEHERFSSLSLPSVIEGDYDWRTEASAEAAPTELLEGVGVSAGKVEGKACKISGQEEFHRFRANDILIAPFTDPGWAPLFITARGLVTDVGGLLSHGSIVAREYGIPAVVNVKNGMRAIQDGQKITVDGDKGIVCLG